MKEKGKKEIKKNIEKGKISLLFRFLSFISFLKPSLATFRDYRSLEFTGKLALLMQPLSRKLCHFSKYVFLPMDRLLL
jgi:hypothetical protein